MIRAGVVIALVLLLVLANYLLARVAQRRFFYPRPQRFPDSADDRNITALLARLDEVLRDRAPAVAAALRPGLSDPQIDELERRHRCPLREDLRALYNWHDGTAREDYMKSLIPGHRFVPLAEAMELRDAMAREVQSLPPTQRLIHWIVAGHRLGWVHVLDDGCGDGYFFDPARRDADGSFFFFFAEDRLYHYFRTVGDFVAGVIECYQSGAYRPAGGAGADGEVDEDFEKAADLWPRFAAVVS